MCRSARRYATILLFKAHLWGGIASRTVGAHGGICCSRAAFAGTGQAGVAPDRPAATGFRIPPLRQHALVRNAPHQIVRVCRRFTHCQQKQQKCQRSRESLHGSGHGCIMRAIACTFQPGLLLDLLNEARPAPSIDTSAGWPKIVLRRLERRRGQPEMVRKIQRQKFYLIKSPRFN